jgi:hypothetical protein
VPLTIHHLQHYLIIIEGGVGTLFFAIMFAFGSCVRRVVDTVRMTTMWMVAMMITGILSLSIAALEHSSTSAYGSEFIWNNNSVEFITRPPTYCIDPQALSIFQRRFQCMAQSSAAEELEQIARTNAFEYFRAHELLAHEFLMKDNNAFRVGSCKDAEFEYIPLLPLHWIASSVDVKKHCSYSALIEDVVAYMRYLKSQKSMQQINYETASSTHQLPIRFSVASTFNLRTAMGTGMPTQVRKGEIYDLVTLFVTTLSIGHYERWPQCPDLLRKSWRYVMELPYVPALSMYDAKLPTATVGSSSSIVTGQRSINFLFAGRLNLWGPERVCSVRKFVTKLASRSDTVILHVSEPQSMSPTRPELFRDYLSRSVFCIVTKADSYSTSFFYSALHAGCVPIIVSDWFVFAFPWLIRYEEFSIRILEEDFLKNPHEVIDHVFAEYLTHANKDKLSALQRGIAKWIPFLSFGEVDTTSEGYKLSQSMLFGPNINVPMPVVLKKSVWPWELMLYELRYAQLPEKVHPIVPCYGPFKCTWNGKTLADVAFAPFNTKVKNKVVSKLAENRTHLCKHSSRLIGHYKIVYFMQCVRILWPLTPGKLNKLDLPVNSPVDRAVIVNGDEGVRDDALKSSQLDGEDLAFVLNFHALTNMSKAGKWSWTTYPTFDEEKRIRQFT